MRYADTCCCLVLLPLFFLCVCVCDAHEIPGDFTFAYVHGPVTQLPHHPEGCEVRQYKDLQILLSPMDKRKARMSARHKRVWKAFFHGGGIDFPMGGFVIYDPAVKVCTIAATPGELDIIESWYYGCIEYRP